MRRLDLEDWRDSPLLASCRLSPGEVWEDQTVGHRVMVGNATSAGQVATLCGSIRADVHVHDPPYQVGNGSALAMVSLEDYGAFTRSWVENALAKSADDAHVYVWVGADQRRSFYPLPEVIDALRSFPELTSRSMITLRNQRGYGTQKNWMAVRQELLYYVRGNPEFAVTYTDIPRRTGGYHRADRHGTVTTNDERSRSPTIRPGNVWFDIQQVFYRMQENVAGAYAQKPLAAIERILRTAPGAVTVLDLFAHSGTTLLAAERAGLRCLTMDVNPLFAELSIRRLERFRTTGRTGWGRTDPFAR